MIHAHSEQHQIQTSRIIVTPIRRPRVCRLPPPPLPSNVCDSSNPTCIKKGGGAGRARYSILSPLDVSTILHIKFLLMSRPPNLFILNIILWGLNAPSLFSRGEASMSTGLLFRHPYRSWPSLMQQCKGRGTVHRHEKLWADLTT